jgi:translation initiation factor 1 (eIF-1/SUI1)
MSVSNATTTKNSSSTIVLSNIVPLNIATITHLSSSNNIIDDDDGFGRKILISVHRGKKTITKIEGIPDKFNLVKILKKLKSKDVLSCGGHIAKDKETDKEFIVVQGSYSSEIAAFLTQEGIAEERFIIFRG